MKEVVQFVIGDWSCDGHGLSDTFSLMIEHNCEDIKKRLLDNEEKIKNEWNLDISRWFSDYEDNIINSEDVEILRNHNIKFDENDIDEDGELHIHHAGSFLDIWIQLMHSIDKDIKITKCNYKTYISNCSGYGLFFI